MSVTSANVRSPVTVRIASFQVVAAYLVAFNALMLLNVILPGQPLRSILLLPFAVVFLALTVASLVRLLSGLRPVDSWLEFFVIAYFIGSLASVVLYAQPGNPASVAAYIYGINLQVVPMLLFFSVRGMTAGDARALLKAVIFLQAWIAAIGILLYFTRPDFYAAYLQQTLGREPEFQVFSRMQSYVGSTALGILSAVSIVLLTNVSVRPLLKFALLALFLLAIFLAQQRGAYVTGTLATAYFLYREKISPLQASIAIGCVIAVLMVMLAQLDLDVQFLSGIVDNRLVADLLQGDPFGERAKSYVKGLEFLSQYPFGLGLGATMSAADDAGAHVGGQIVDAYFMRVACDMGLPGAALFGSVLIAAVYAGLRSRIFHGFALVVAIYVIQATGTNVLDSQYVSQIFWLLLGLVGGTAADDIISKDGRHAESRYVRIVRTPSSIAYQRQGGELK